MKNPNQQLQRIEAMEHAMTQYSQALQQAQQALVNLQAIQSQYLQLRDYYGDPVYMEDLDYSNSPDFPAGQPAGVLSEDGLYNLFDDHRQLALDLLDTASEMLRN